MFSRITRNLMGVMMWIVILSICIAVNGVLLTADFLNLRTSFELLGWEMMPLGMDRLVGGVFNAFFSEATMAHLYALAFSMTLALGFFILFHLGFEIYDLYQDRRDYRGSSYQEEASRAMRLILRKVTIIGVLLVPTILVIIFDIILFRYRWVCGALGIEDPSIAVSTVKTWKLLLEERGDLFALSMARFGAWGYIGVTATACLCLEFSLRRLGEYWARLCDSLAEIRHPAERSDGGERDGVAGVSGDPGGADGGHVTDPDYSQFHQDNMGQRDIDPEPSHQSYQDNARPPRVNDPTSNRGQDAGEINSPEQDTQLREVIGTGERISLTEAMSRPDLYWVDPESQEIWDRNMRDSLLDGQNGEGTDGNTRNT